MKDIGSVIYPTCTVLSLSGFDTRINACLIQFS